MLSVELLNFIIVLSSPFQYLSGYRYGGLVVFVGVCEPTTAVTFVVNSSNVFFPSLQNLSHQASPNFIRLVNFT